VEEDRGGSRKTPPGKKSVKGKKNNWNTKKPQPKNRNPVQLPVVEKPEKKVKPPPLPDKTKPPFTKSKKHLWCVTHGSLKNPNGNPMPGTTENLRQITKK